MELNVGQIVEGKITGITNFGVFVDLGENKSGLVHISEVARSFVRYPLGFFVSTRNTPTRGVFVLYFYCLICNNVHCILWIELVFHTDNQSVSAR